MHGTASGEVSLMHLSLEIIAFRSASGYFILKPKIFGSMLSAFLIHSVFEPTFGKPLYFLQKKLLLNASNGICTLYRNGTRTGKDPKWKVQYLVEMFKIIGDRGPIVSYCTCPISCTIFSLVSEQCEYAMIPGVFQTINNILDLFRQNNHAKLWIDLSLNTTEKS